MGYKHSTVKLMYNWTGTTWEGLAPQEANMCLEAFEFAQNFLSSSARNPRNEFAPLPFVEVLQTQVGYLWEILGCMNTVLLLVANMIKKENKNKVV